MACRESGLGDHVDVSTGVGGRDGYRTVVESHSDHFLTLINTLITWTGGANGCGGP